MGTDLSNSRQHRQITLFESAARTESVNTADFNNPTARGIILFLNITAASGSAPTLDLKIQDRDHVSGEYTDIPGASFAQKNTTGNFALVVYPGITDSSNAAVSMVVPRTFRIVCEISDGASFTFSLGGELLI